MGFVSGLLQPFGPQAMTSHELQTELLRGHLADSGAYVTEDSAMRLSWFWAGVRVLAEDTAKVPLLVYERMERGKRRATEHWLYRLLHDEPNPFQTPFEFREMLTAHAVVSGNAFALKTVVRGVTRELLPVPPWRVQVERDGLWGRRYWVALPDQVRREVPASLVFHLPGLGFDGLTGMSVVSYQREAIGLGAQMTRHAAKTFAQGALIGGTLEHPGRLSADAHGRLKDSFEAKYTGVTNAHKVILLEEGAKFNKLGMTHEDAEFLEQRKFNRSEIAAILRIRPHKIGDMEKATFSNIEHQAIEHVTDDLQPWYTRWEQRLSRSLLSPADRERYVVEHLLEGLLRGDYKTRTEGHAKMIEMGVASPNDVRELENMNAVDGLDFYRVPLNMQTIGPDAIPLPAKTGAAA